MKDIEALKAKHAQEIADAIAENEVNEKLGRDAVRVSGESFTRKGKRSLWADCQSIYEMRDIMAILPMTEKSRAYTAKGEYEKLSYIFTTERNAGEPKTRLTMEYISGEYDVTLHWFIDTANVDIMQYFTTAYRELSDTEVRLYIGQKTRYNYDHRMNFPFLTFNSGHVIRYQGGTHKQVSEGHACCLASTIQCINDYE